MDEKKFLIVVCMIAAILIAGLGIVAVSIHLTKKQKLQDQVNAYVRRADAVVERSRQLCTGAKWDKAVDELAAMHAEIDSSLLARHLSSIAHRLEQEIDSAKRAKQEYSARIAAGWSVFENRFISPDEKNSILRQRRQEEERRREAERAQRERQEREAARREHERLVKQQQEAEKKAREMYGPYKDNAEKLADTVLKMISATETGINYSDHSKMLQDLQFAYNKFKMTCTETDLSRESYKHLERAVEQFRSAQGWWGVKIEAAGMRGMQGDYEQKLQEAWAQAGEEYTAAMSKLSENR